LLEHQDYVALRRIAQGAYAATNISGFSIRTNLIPKGKEEILNDLGSLRRKLIAQEDQLKKRGAPLQQLSIPQFRDGIVSATLDYQRMITGRVELIQKVDTEVKFAVEPVDQQLWRVVCFPKANQDIKKIESLFKQLDSGAYEPFIISLEEFQQKQRIQFFDDILDFYSQDDEWRFVEVTGITIRQDKDDDFVLLEADELETDDGESNEAEDADLLSISQAVLQGQSLRTNSFVKKCESQGFYFLAMTLSLESKKNTELIKVTIRFKLSPKMFEVILTGMSERTAMGDTPTSFTYDRQQGILKGFWVNCHRIWQDANRQEI
jgi:pyridoxine/pyridoxamine 5'-phosphate oxidase